MKKSYVYFIAPLLGVAVFAGFYWNYAQGLEARQEATKKAQIEAKNEKIRQENLQKKAAVEAALAAQEKRKQEKKEREEREAREKEQRELALQARTKAKEDARKFREQVTRLNKEVEETKKELAEIEADQKVAKDEQVFLRDLVKKAEATAQGYQQTLERIEAAEKAAEAAAKAAAAAAAKK